jgi:hypothetical protein
MFALVPIDWTTTNSDNANSTTQPKQQMNHQQTHSCAVVLHLQRTHSYFYHIVSTCQQCRLLQGKATPELAASYMGASALAFGHGMSIDASMCYVQRVADNILLKTMQQLQHSMLLQSALGPGGSGT